MWRSHDPLETISSLAIGALLGANDSVLRARLRQSGVAMSDGKSTLSVVLDQPGTAMCECGGQVALFLRQQEGGYLVKCFACNLTTIIRPGSEYARRIADLLVNA